MELIGSALGIILLIIVIILIVKFIRFLFLNWFVSRILSIVTAFISLLVALGGADFWACVLLTAASWCFFIGPVIFDVEYDGTYSVSWNDTYDRATVTPNKTGGFFFNVALSIVVVTIIYIIFGSEYPVVYVLLPLGLLVTNAWTTRTIWVPLLVTAIQNLKNKP